MEENVQHNLEFDAEALLHGRPGWDEAEPDA